MDVVTLVIVGRHAEQIGDLLSDKQAEVERRRPERKPVRAIAFMDMYEADEDPPRDVPPPASN
jgi:hypothetical protein